MQVKVVVEEPVRLGLIYCIKMCKRFNFIKEIGNGEIARNIITEDGSSFHLSVI